VFSQTDFSEFSKLLDVKRLSQFIKEDNPLFYLVKSTTGLMMSIQRIWEFSSFLWEANLLDTKLSQVDLNKQVTNNTAVVTHNVVETGGALTVNNLENAFSTLQRRPDNADVLVANGNLTIEGDDIVGFDNAFRVDKPVTFLIQNGGNLIIKTDIIYGTGTGKRPSVAFVVKDGNLLIDPAVSRLDGVYVVMDGGKKIDNRGHNLPGGDPCRYGEITTSGRCGYYSSNQLVINGSLFGEMQDLAKHRTYVGDPYEDGGAIVINYDARIVTDTPPGLRELLANLWEKVIR
jgi:hypothetical protein